jgi:four helix bundle protein
MPSQCYRDLLVWQNAMDLVEDIYRRTEHFPKAEEFGLKAQMRRAAVSVPSNIAEGQGRHRPKVFREFLNIAMGSLSELETQIHLAVRLHFISQQDCDSLCSRCAEVGKMLYGLSNSIASRNR